MRVRRRRRPTTAPGERERADAPRRDEGGGAAPPPSSGGFGGPPSGGSPIPGGGMPGGKLSLPMILLLVAVMAVLFLFNRGGDGGGAGDMVNLAATQMAGQQPAAPKPYSPRRRRRLHPPRLRRPQHPAKVADHAHQGAMTRCWRDISDITDRAGQLRCRADRQPNSTVSRRLQRTATGRRPKHASPDDDAPIRSQEIADWADRL